MGLFSSSKSTTQVSDQRIAADGYAVAVTGGATATINQTSPQAYDLIKYLYSGTLTALDQADARTDALVTGVIDRNQKINGQQLESDLKETVQTLAIYGVVGLVVWRMTKGNFA